MRFWVNVSAICLLSLCIAGFVQSALAVTYQEAADQVANADQTLRSAFNSVSDAEQSGANVSILLSRLTEASSVLTQAEEALMGANYSSTVNLAGTCKSLATVVGEDAVALKSDVAAASGNWWITVLLSSVASVATVVAVFFVWRWFRRNYLRKMMESRPEVTG